jgi:tripartite-type tricarboxylate transporter receptor subunit TctC
VPKAVLERMQADIVKAAQTSNVQQFYRQYTLTFVGNTPAEFDQFVKTDRENAAKIFRKMGFKPGQPTS